MLKGKAVEIAGSKRFWKEGDELALKTDSRYPSKYLNLNKANRGQLPIVLNSLFTV